MKTTSQCQSQSHKIKSLIYLLDEPDEHLYINIANAIVAYGRQTLPLLKEKLGQTTDSYLKERIDQDRPHNLLIYLACVSGIPGMIIYVIAVSIIVINGIIKLFKNNQSGKIFLIIVITYLISSMFGNSMYYTSPYFFIFLGSLMHCNLQKQEK